MFLALPSFWIRRGRIFALGNFLCIPTPNADQLNPLFHTFAEFRLIVNRVEAWQSTDWLETNAQFSLSVTVDSTMKLTS